MQQQEHEPCHGHGSAIAAEVVGWLAEDGNR
jgi:hypothetical protein